jgi:hypothetical protein
VIGEIMRNTNSMRIVEYLAISQNGPRELPSELQGFPNDVGALIIGIGVSCNPAVAEGMIPSLLHSSIRFIEIGLLPLLDATPMGQFGVA